MSVTRSDSDIAARIEEAWRLQRLGQNAQAEAIYRVVLQGQPDNATVWHNLGLIAAQTGAADASIQLFRRAVAHEPGNARFQTNLAQALRSAGQLEEAVAVAGTTVTRQPAEAKHRRMLRFAP